MESHWGFEWSVWTWYDNTLKQEDFCVESRLQGDKGESRVKNQEATGQVKDDGDMDEVAGVEVERGNCLLDTFKRRAEGRD